MWTMLKKPEPEPVEPLTPEEHAEVAAALVNGRRQQFQSARLQKKDRGLLLTNVYSWDVIQVWLKADPSDGLKPTEVDVDEEVGRIPEWYDYDVNELGWDSIIGAYRHSSPDQHGNTWSEGWLLWCLERGIAPSQPFLVELPRPYHSVSHTQDGTEYDTEYEPEIIAVLHWKPSRVLKAWGRELESEIAFRRAETARRRKLHSIQQHDVKSMFVSFGSYFAPGQSLYDDMEMPMGYYFCLQTNANLDKTGMTWAMGTLARGESNKGDHTEAMEALIADATKRLPHLTAEQIRSLPKRSSNW